jgi:hypothetical protein
VRGPALGDLHEEIVHLGGADAAGHASPARLGAAELHEELRDVDHAGRLVHHDHAARSHDRAGFPERFVVDGHIEKLLGNTASGRPSGLHRLEALFVGNAAPDLEDDLAQRNAHRNLDEPGVADAAGEREDLGAFGFLRPDRGIPIAAVLDDPRNARKGLDVIDERGTSPETGFGRIRRAGARLAASALDRSDERGFLAADESAGAEADLDVEVEGRLADLLAEKLHPFRLLDRGAEAFHGERILGADIEIAARGADRIGGDRHAFEHAVRIRFENAPVHECARIALVGVADHIFLAAARLRDRAPFESRRVSAAAAATKSALQDLLDNLVRFHLGERLRERSVGARGDCVLDALRVDDAGVLEDDAHLTFEERSARRMTACRERPAVEAIDQRGGVLGRNVRVERPGF